MTIEVPTDIEWARYNGSPMHDLPQFGEDVRWCVPGCVMKVTDETRHRVLRYIHGGDSERAYFRPVEDSYVATLNQCQAHGVAFESDAAYRRHVDAVLRAASQNRNLAERDHLQNAVAKKVAEIEAAKHELEALKERLEEAERRAAGTGLQCFVVNASGDRIL